MRAKVRMVEQFADEAMLAGNLPPIWMPYWSEPQKRDSEAVFDDVTPDVTLVKFLPAR
jgi:hypothetical protein